jgi:hypothetical protein
MILKIFSPNFLEKKLAFLTQNKAKLCKNLIITLAFVKNANFCHRKLSKIAENRDRNIDPWTWTTECALHFTGLPDMPDTFLGPTYQKPK